MLHHRRGLGSWFGLLCNGVCGGDGRGCWGGGVKGEGGGGRGEMVCLALRESFHVGVQFYVFLIRFLFHSAFYV